MGIVQRVLFIILLVFSVQTAALLHVYDETHWHETSAAQCSSPLCHNDGELNVGATTTLFHTPLARYHFACSVTTQPNASVLRTSIRAPPVSFS